MLPWDKPKGLRSVGDHALIGRRRYPLKLDRPSRFGRLINAADDFDRASPFVAIDLRDAPVLDGRDDIPDLHGVPMVADGCRVAGPAARGGLIGKLPADLFVPFRGICKIPNLDIFLFEDRTTSSPVNFNPFQHSGIRRGGRFDSTQGTILKSQRGNSDVLDFDSFVCQRRHLCADFGDHSKRSTLWMA